MAAGLLPGHTAAVGLQSAAVLSVHFAVGRAAMHNYKMNVEHHSKALIYFTLQFLQELHVTAEKEE